MWVCTVRIFGSCDTVIAHSGRTVLNKNENCPVFQELLVYGTHIDTFTHARLPVPSYFYKIRRILIII